jgi:hypothetical protein
MLSVVGLTDIILNVVAPLFIPSFVCLCLSLTFASHSLALYLNFIVSIISKKFHEKTLFVPFKSTQTKKKPFFPPTMLLKLTL